MSPTPQATASEHLAQTPVLGVVRTPTFEQAAEVAQAYLAAGLTMLEVTFSVPRAVELVEHLKRLPQAGDVSIGMGTVTTPERARRALDVEADFIVTPNVQAEVAELALEADRLLILGALTATEIVAAQRLGTHLVKVFPLPPVGGPAYLEAVRQPLSDVPMVAAGGFGVEEIPAYGAAGASAFGLGPPLVGSNRGETVARVQRAIELARAATEPPVAETPDPQERP